MSYAVEVVVWADVLVDEQDLVSASVGMAVWAGAPGSIWVACR